MTAVRSFAFALLLTGTAAPVFGAGYVPVSDSVLDRLGVTPQSASEVTAQCDQRLDALKQLRARFEALPLSTQPMVMLAAYDDLYNLAITANYSEPTLIKDTHPDPAVRKAAEECMERAGAALISQSMSPAIYERLRAIEKTQLPPRLGYMLERQLTSFRRSGVDKDPATRARIADLQNRINSMVVEFERNIAADDRTVAATVSELRGVPADWMAAHPADAKGVIRMRVTYADTAPVLAYAENVDVRKRVMLARSDQGYPANEAVLQRLIAARAELATLFDYPNYAAFEFANSMAGSPARVKSFIDAIDTSARPVAEAQAKRMLERLRKDDPSLKTLDGWSSAYALRLVRTEGYDVDPKIIRNYFAFDKVKSGILDLTTDLFGVQIRPWTTEVWHEDVSAFEMVQEGRVIGRFYLDMHPRPGKYTHAQMAPLRIGIRGRSVPVAVLETNFPKGPMEHRDVVTFLHEFGHLLHWIFSGQQPYAMQNAMELENDVIEAPSQLLEEWVWDPATLKRFATNDAGEPIPTTLVEKMNAGRRFGEAFDTMTQLGYASAALTLYSDPMEGRDLAHVYDATYDRYSLAAVPPGTHRYAAFSHLGGYGASYYTYGWSKALASDLLSEFREKGLRDTATAQRYRDTVLAPGGSTSMNVLARNFLARDWTVDAYQQELKLGE